MDVDHGDDFVGDVELDGDLDVVVQLDVDVRLSVVPAMYTGSAEDAVHF